MGRGSSVDELIPSWVAAERGLYPVVLSEPEAYERYVRLIGMVVGVLQAYRTTDELVRAWGHCDEIVGEVATREGERGLNVAVVAAAAFRLRHAALVAEAEREDARRRIAGARRSGSVWVVLLEQGSRDPMPLPFAEPYRRLEMHLPDGTGIHAFVEFDPDSMQPRYAVEVLELNRDSGEVLLGSGGGMHSRRRVFDRSEDWERCVRELRERLPASRGRS